MMVKNATDGYQELGIDGQQEVNNDQNAAVDDHSTGLPPFTAPRPDLHCSDDNDED